MRGVTCIEVGDASLKRVGVAELGRADERSQRSVSVPTPDGSAQASLKGIDRSAQVFGVSDLRWPREVSQGSQ